ncbi:hypothetical protein F4604DRAFT_436904 [Suillus subluteus]|nr:hypothetical protein F4604DRAFT_436904 [Suillus subluteus]
MPDVAASRKFIDLIRQASSKWANWDPPIEIKVGDYGKIDNKTGKLDVEGNIYEKTFQTLLDKQGLKINLSASSCQPQKGGLDDNMIMSSSGVKQGDFSAKPEVSLLNLASASVKAEFQFQEGKRGAVLVMHKPQQEYIPRGKVLTLVHKAIELHGKYLVTSTFKCPGYYIYLSNKSGERIALALARTSVPWRADPQPAIFRQAMNNDGHFCYTPLYSLKHRGTKWFRRKYPGAEEKDGMWLDCSPPWDPLDEDGNELHMETDDMRARKFIDLIHQTSFKWANWNPAIEIKVGLSAVANAPSSLPHLYGL